MHFDPARAKSLFLNASELADLAKRAAYLDRECGGDAELRERVEALLRANDSAPLLPVVAATMDSVPGQPQTEDRKDPNAQVGVVIAGKYMLAEVIGEGGMGSVWRAKQSEPVKRFVAVKLIKAGMDSRQVLARFDAERQALALMDHPNIAKVLDGGLHEQRPFFVMELVKGTPITEFCDAGKLTPQARLELFVQACQAIQHAHQKGIIHRDIKPSNVLVALYDDKPVVKVIDFGVAKATGGALTEATIDTGFGSVVGTPEHMSPEQATFNNLDIDTRSDVYALGVLLYELLAGSPPFSKQELEKKGLLEMLRVVREEEPPRPSTKLSTADALPSLSANRSTEPKQLTGLLKNELDWIVMKALEKDRARRYETANGFAADVLRYLAGEPVQAHPPSTAYRVKKFVRRNKPQVIAVGLVLLALVAGVIGTTVGLVQANRAAKAEKVAKLDADAKREEAERNLGFAKKGNELLGSVFAGLDPKNIAESGRPLQDVLRENLVKAVKELEGSAIGDPLEVAAMQSTLGHSLLGLGETKLAVEVFAKALDTYTAKLGHDHSNTLSSRNNLAVAYHVSGKPDLALPLFEETLKLQQVKLGLDHPSVLDTMHNLAIGYQDAGQLDKALPLFEESLNLQKAKLGIDHASTLSSMNNLALGYLDAGMLDKALPLLKETLKLQQAKLSPDHPDTLATMGNLALSYHLSGKPDVALPLFEETLRLRKATLGPDHPDTLTSMNNLASMGYQDAGQLDKALPLLEESLKIRKAKLGLDHRDTLTSMNNLALCYQDAGELEKALPLYEETLKLTKAMVGPDHPDTFTSMNNLALGYQGAGMLDEALLLFEETLKLTKAKLGPDHPDTLSSMNNLALGYQGAGMLDKALPLFEETLKLQRAKLGNDHPHTFLSMNSLAEGYRDDGQLDKALPLLEEALKLTKARLGPDHPDTLTSMNDLAACYWFLKRLDRSIPLFEELLPLQEQLLGRTHLDTQLTVANLGVNYKDDGRLPEAIRLLEEAYPASKKHDALRFVGDALLDAYAQAGKPAEAAKLIDELLADARKMLPEDSPELSGMMAQFGLSLLEMKAYAEAETPLREALAIREKTQPDAWTTFNTQSLLGGALLGQKKFADAEPLLLAGYEGIKAREKTIPPQGIVRISETLDRLIDLNTATNKPDEVTKWQSERAKYP